MEETFRLELIYHTTNDAVDKFVWKIYYNNNVITIGLVTIEVDKGGKESCSWNIFSSKQYIFAKKCENVEKVRLLYREYLASHFLERVMLT